MTPQELAVRATALKRMQPSSDGKSDHGEKLTHDNADEFRDFMRSYGVEND